MHLVGSSLCTGRWRSSEDTRLLWQRLGSINHSVFVRVLKISTYSERHQIAESQPTLLTFKGHHNILPPDPAAAAWTVGWGGFCHPIA